jgi:hypothetical protein
MPYGIHKRGKGYAIVNKNTGKTVAHSTSKAKAQKSINARNAAAHGAKLGKRR